MNSANQTCRECHVSNVHIDVKILYNQRTFLLIIQIFVLNCFLCMEMIISRTDFKAKYNPHCVIHFCNDFFKLQANVKKCKAMLYHELIQADNKRMKSLCSLALVSPPTPWTTFFEMSVISVN